MFLQSWSEYAESNAGSVNIPGFQVSVRVWYKFARLSTLRFPIALEHIPTTLRIPFRHKRYTRTLLISIRMVMSIIVLVKLLRLGW